MELRFILNASKNAGSALFRVDRFEKVCFFVKQMSKQYSSTLGKFTRFL